MRTLCIDIGGTGIKSLILDEEGQPITDRVRRLTPKPATPEAVFLVIDELRRAHGEFDRVSLGFPGVIKEGVVKSAPHLDPSWFGVDLKSELERRVERPARVANDALIHGLGVIEGQGFEVVITLGTGLGCGIYIDGKAAQLELGHHPIGKRKTYEHLIGEAARKAAGNARWNKRVRKVIQQIEATFNYRKLYIGGGNARRLDREQLPEDVVVIDNIAGLLGGIRLWG
jgi:polyphosphate glucokinase